MAKQSYVVQHISGSRFMVETTSLKAAIAKSAWPSKEIISAYQVSGLKSAVRFTTIGASGSYCFKSPEGYELSSDDMAVFNAALERLGYKPVAVTYNVLNPGFGSILIDADTPYCCNPASEAYHSM